MSNASRPGVVVSAYVEIAIGRRLEEIVVQRRRSDPRVAWTKSKVLAELIARAVDNERAA